MADVALKPALRCGQRVLLKETAVRYGRIEATVYGKTPGGRWLVRRDHPSPGTRVTASIDPRLIMVYPGEVECILVEALEIADA